MLFWSPQPKILEREIQNMMLTLDKMRSLNHHDQSGITVGMARNNVGLKGPSVSAKHKAIHNHSRRAPHARWVWISKISTVNVDGMLGFPASAEEIKRFSANARKVFLKKPPSELQESFARVVVMNRVERKVPAGPWKRRGEGGTQEHRDVDQK
jgi:hypothetical protein